MPLTSATPTGGNHDQSLSMGDQQAGACRLRRDPGHARRRLRTDIVWLDVYAPPPDEDHRVEKLLAISLPTREEMEEIEVSARLYQEDSAEFMTLTAIVKSDTDDPETTPITFVLKENTLVTLRYAEPKAFVNYLSRAQSSARSPAPAASRSCWR